MFHPRVWETPTFSAQPPCFWADGTARLRLGRDPDDAAVQEAHLSSGPRKVPSLLEEKGLDY